MVTKRKIYKVIFYGFNMKSTLRTAGIMATLGLAGCGYYGEEPKREDYSRFEATINDGYHRIIDIDGDGDADVIAGDNGMDRSHVYWVAPDMVDFIKGGRTMFEVDKHGETPRMTPKIQELATRIMHDQGELSYLNDLARHNRAIAKLKSERR